MISHKTILYKQISTTQLIVYLFFWNSAKPKVENFHVYKESGGILVKL